MLVGDGGRVPRREPAVAVGPLPLIDRAGKRFHVRAQVGAAYFAERPQVSQFGLEFLLLRRLGQVAGGTGGVGGLARARVRRLQDHAGAHLRLAHNLIAAHAGVHGEFPAVFLRVGHITVGGLLRVRQQVHRLDVGVLRPGANSPAPEQPLTQPQDLRLQHAVVVQQQPESIGNPLTERADLRLVETAAPEPGRRESRRPHSLRRQQLAIRVSHDSLQPKSST